MTDDDRGRGADQPVIAFVEWPTKGLDLAAARHLAAETDRIFQRIPGLLDARYFGDFESGIHFYMLTWRDRAALDAYIGSEAMFSNRVLAEPFVAGRPSRKVLVDYSPQFR